MKKIILIVIFIFFSSTTNAKDIVDNVNVHIGAISHLLQPTFTTIHIPNSMVRIIPITTPGISDTYLASKIYGFPINCPAHRYRYIMSVMPVSGELVFDPEAMALEYDHDFETATPYYYAVTLGDDDINVELTPTERCAYYRFSFTKPEESHLVLNGEDNAEFHIIDDTSIRAMESFEGVQQFVYINFNKSFVSHNVYKADTPQNSKNQVNGNNVKAVITFNTLPTDTIEMKYGVSYISIDQARINLENEIPEWSFTKTKQTAKEKWNSELGKIQVKGGTDDEKTAFYSALYRCLERMVNVSEDGKYFSAYDNKIHSDDRDFYIDDWSWDSYRAHHPLRILLNPDMEQDIIQSYVRMYQQSGWMPTFPQIFGDRKCMIGHHQAAIIADAWLKGLRNFDMDSAYEGLYKNAATGTMVPWQEGKATELDSFYREHGYFPALAPGTPETVKTVSDFEKRQAVAVTLEHAYDEWCLAQLAQSLNKTDDYTLLKNRGYNYKNVYNPQTGFMSPKTADGAWVEPFDPKRSGGTGCRDYFAEISSWTYSFHVQQDVAGLIDLMGGNKQFINRLDQLFNEPLFGYCRWTQHSEIPDGTGLVGQFVMGNEQSFHVPYLYVYAGAPWKSQKRLRQLMNTWFRNDLMGICGDEDGGAMSAWYVFSAMGFYPVCPGQPVYIIGSPLFKEISISLTNRRSFTIKAHNNSRQNKYIQSATINGKPLTRAWITHKEIIDGAELELQMGPRPNKKWGTDPLPPAQ